MRSRYVVEGWIPHLAAFTFGRPHRDRWWDKPHLRRRWHVGYDKAQERIAHEAELRRLGAAMTNVRQAGERAMRVRQAQTLKREGMDAKGIAEAMQVSLAAVYSYLDAG